MQSLIPDLPRTAEIVPNSVYPVVGGVTVLMYRETPHYAFNTAVTEEGVMIQETNFVHGKYTSRLLTWQYLQEHQAWYWRTS